MQQINYKNYQKKKLNIIINYYFILKINRNIYKNDINNFISVIFLRRIINLAMMKNIVYEIEVYMKILKEV